MSLLEICKGRILNEMVHATRNTLDVGDNKSAFAAMIVDQNTLRVLSSSCKVYDVLEAGITVVEMISKHRQPLPQLDAIYFLTPEKSSVTSLLEDFQHEKKPQYKSIHLFFADSIMTQKDLLPLLAKGQGLIPRIRSFVDFNLNFIAYESRVFHLDHPNALMHCFPTLHSPDILHVIANKLLTVCLTLGDKPLVRYHKNDRDLSEQLAMMLQEMIDACSVDQVSRGQSTLLILDRSVDVSALLLHEYTYQALAYDVVDIPCCTPPEEHKGKPADQIYPDDSFEYETTNNRGEKELRTAVLGEQDEVYQKYKHGHITVVAKKVTEDIKKFNKDNAAVAAVQQAGVSVKDASAAVRALPQYGQMLAKYYVHVTLTEMCFAELTKQGVMKAGGIEQDLATGVDRKGKVIEAEKVLGQMGGLLNDPTVGSIEKMRLLLLYFCNMDGVKDEDIRKMLQAASLSLDLNNRIHNFLKLGLNKTASLTSGNKGIQHEHKFTHDKEKLQFFQRRAKSGGFELSRYECAIKEIMEQLVSGQLHNGKFPYVEEAGRPRGRGVFGLGGGMEAAADVRTNVRAKQKDWDWDFEGTGDSSQKNATATGRPEKDVLSGVGKHGGRGRFIVFIIGGITMAEMRSVYEVAKKAESDLFLGGDMILTPGGLLRMLKAKAST